MRKLLLGGVALAALAAGPALAADLPVRQPVYKAPPPSLYNWTGFYWGVNVGYSWGRQRNDFTVTGFPTSTETQNVDGVVGGLQWGYNWQIGNFVLGTESDFQWSGQKGSTTYCVIDCATATLTAEHKLPWFGTARSRLGVLVTPNILLYATGGLAYGQVKSDYTLAGGGNVATLSFRDTRAGYAVGAGVEGAVAGGWSAKLEYLFVDLGKNTQTSTFNGVTVATFDSRFTDNIVRIGFNYKPSGGFF